MNSILFSYIPSRLFNVFIDQTFSANLPMSKFQSLLTINFQEIWQNLSWWQNTFFFTLTEKKGIDIIIIFLYFRLNKREHKTDSMIRKKKINLKPSLKTNWPAIKVLLSSSHDTNQIYKPLFVLLLLKWIETTQYKSNTV